MATEQRRADIEFAIQDLMYHAVVACRKPLGVIEGGVNKVIVMINSNLQGLTSFHTC